MNNPGNVDARNSVAGSRNPGDAGVPSLQRQSTDGSRRATDMTWSRTRLICCAIWFVALWSGVISTAVIVWFWAGEKKGDVVYIRRSSITPSTSSTWSQTLSELENCGSSWICTFSKWQLIFATSICGILVLLRTFWEQVKATFVQLAECCMAIPSSCGSLANGCLKFMQDSAKCGEEWFECFSFCCPCFSERSSDDRASSNAVASGDPADTEELAELGLCLVPARLEARRNTR